MHSNICLGTVQFGKNYGINNNAGQVPKKEVFKILDFAAKNGIKWLDTAEDYGNAQKILGEYLKSNSGLFKIQSKISSESTDLRSSLNKTLNDLNIDSIDSYLFHSYQKFKLIKSFMKEDLLKLKENRLCKSLGVSIYENTEGLDEELIKFSDEVQFPFNILDNLSRREILIKSCSCNNIKIQTRSVFLQGALLMNPKNLLGNLRPLYNPINELEKVSRKFKLSKVQLSLGYAFHFNFSDKILIGVDSLNQLQNNLKIIEDTSIITKEILEHLNNISVPQIELLNPSKWTNKQL